MVKSSKALAGMVVALLAAPVLAQPKDEFIPPYQSQVPHYCIPPQEPILDQASLDYIGISLAGEFSRYFNDANAYIVCLDRSHTETVQRVREYGDLYRSIVNQE